jgi:hypothetical protein
LRGKSQWQIAQELDINQGTVSRHLEALLAEWRASNEFAIDAILHRELAKIDLIEAEAWTAWERSKENKERTTKERASGDSAARSKVVVVTENRLPENEFLKAVMACINKRCEILGLDAATKIKHEGEIDAMSEVEKRAMIAGIAAKLGAMADDRAHEDDGPVADGGGMGSDAEAGEGMGIEAGAAEGCPAVSPGNAPHSGGHWYGAIR